MNRIIVYLVSFFLCNSSIFAQNSLNLDFELINYGNLLPKNWNVQGTGFKVSLDSLEKHNGKFSLKTEVSVDPNAIAGGFKGGLPLETFAGKTVEYKGWLKTKDLKSGYAGLWLRVFGANGVTLQWDNMSDRGLTGDNNWTQVSIKLDIDKDATDILFGGLFPREGIAWFDDLELYINGEKFIDIIEPEPKKTLSQKEIVALKKYIYPLRTYEPDDGNTNDLNILNDLIGNSKVVALGENTHGSSEIFKMKNRIIQYLTVNNGFDIFSIEGSMAESYKINDYTVRGEGDPKKLIADMQVWTWRTEEVLNMVEWMRKFNQPVQRIQFTGFDMHYYDGAINELLIMFKGNEEAETKITDLKKRLDELQDRAKQTRGLINVDPDKINEFNSIISFLQNNTFQPYNKAWFQQNIVIIQQFLRFNSSTWRDKCMADNFMWIKEQNPKSKFITWAHNGHIMKTGQVMGAQLAQKLGNDYITFGFTFFDGSYTANGSKGIASYDAIRAYLGTFEYLLNQLNEPMFILDLKKIKSDNNNETEWLTERLDFREVGAAGGGRVEFRNRKIIEDFDYLIFIKTSTPSVLFPKP